MFVANPDSYAAVQNALDELNHRCWVPEAIEHRDILVREAARKEGGEFWEAYLQAEQGNLFWLEDLENLPMCEKSVELWGTGPRLTETFVDNLIQNSGGHRLTAAEAGEFREKNADYVLSKYVLELKHFENEGLAVETRQKKIGELFQRYFAEGPVRKIDPYNLSDRDFEEYWEIIGVPIQKRIKAASKQVKATIARLGQEQYEGGVILLNTGYLTVPHDFFVAMAERYASKDTSSIRHIIVISSWTITNGFDTVVNYAFHPHETACSYLEKLRDVFWATIENLMTQMITGELNPESGMQQPMSPTYFNHEGEVFTFGVPQLKSSLKRDKNKA